MGNEQSELKSIGDETIDLSKEKLKEYKCLTKEACKKKRSFTLLKYQVLILKICKFSKTNIN